MKRLLPIAIALSLLAPSLPAHAADAALPAELPCGGTSDRARARCITDALKGWKELEHDYDEQEDDDVAAWKTEHVGMGVGSDYQKALRVFLGEVRAKRKAFDAQLREFRKAFFDEQKKSRSTGGTTVRKPARAPAMTIDEASAKCGPVDDDGLYRTCMRQLLRGVPASVTNRSRSNTKLLRR
jgi:hypothetical protein